MLPATFHLLLYVLDCEIVPLLDLKKWGLKIEKY